VVIGNGRLAFYAAPDYGCEMQGVYILPGDTVDALIDRAGFTWVKFRRASTGAEASGWVRSDRLAASGRAAAGPTGAAPANMPGAPAASVVKPPPAVQASPAREDGVCKDAAAAATTGSKPVPADIAGRRVTGVARLQFHSAPDAACTLQGVFILPGEAVTALADNKNYTLVNYINPRNGNEATGWVRSDRLALSESGPARKP
jgi:hypothetical protein